jgi:hypothetical protein
VSSEDLEARALRAERLCLLLGDVVRAHAIPGIVLTLTGPCLAKHIALQASAARLNDQEPEWQEYLANLRKRTR